MKNLFRKTRVIHTPEKQKYDVYAKTGFFSLWEWYGHCRYYVGKKPTSHFSYEPQDNQEEAKAKAIAHAKELANKTIEWES